MPPEQNPQAPNPAPQTPTPSPLKQIRTFQGDVADALSAQKESLFSIQQQELKKSSGYSVPQQEPKKGGGRSFVFLLGSLLFLALAGIGSWYTYTEFLRKTTPPVVTVPSSRLIPAESSREINIDGLSRDAIFAAVTEASVGTNTGELRHLLLKNALGANASTSAFFTKLGTEAPGNLVRALDPAFMLGSLGGGNRFLLIKLASFQNAFAGMLAWEKEMPADLSGLFANVEILKNIDSSSVFTDVVSRNKDVRVLSYNEAPVLVYSFFDNQYLIITENLETLQTILDRLAQNKLTR